MQRLHVVGFTTDHEGLILSARRNAKAGGYMVIADADLEEALVELRRARSGDTDDEGARSPRPESTLSVREMQQRLRAGQSIGEVAAAAGVAEEWIARFAIPIEAEQSLVVQRALDLVASKQRVGPSSQTLGTSAWWNLQDRGVKVSEDDWSQGWSAYLQRDQVWVVQFAYTFRKKRQAAEWEVDLRAGTLHSRNRLGTDLGYVEPGRRRRPGPPKPIPGGLVSRPSPAAPADGDDESATPKPRRVAKRRSQSPAKKRPVNKKPAAKTKASARKATAKKSTAKKAATKRAPAKKSTAKKAPAKKSSPKRSATKRSTAKKAAPRRAPAKKAAVKRALAGRVSTRKAAAKKARPAASNGASPLVGGRPAAARVLVPSATNQPRPAPIIAGASRAGGPVGAEPVAARRRPTGADGQPVRRREPLRARS
ncbi:MAG TPA: septation protein SepH [Acidimicrobiales bacterium]|nr:septation protein SepH [Acidimicrobiales bacterium]